MAQSGPVERLRQFLRELSPRARALLIAELERAALRGDEVPGGDLVLQEVRNAIRESGVETPRVGNPARLFFRPVEPFLSAGHSRTSAAGRIPRDALDPIWTWLVRDLFPHEVRIYSEEVSRALGTGDIARGDRLAAQFQDLVGGRIRDVLAAADADEKTRRKFAAQVNVPNGLQTLRDFSAILQQRDVLDHLGQRLPGHIQNFSGSEVEAVRALLDVMMAQRPQALRLALVLVMRRLAAPWQLIRLTLSETGGGETARAAADRFADAVTLVLAEIEDMIAELAGDLRHVASISVVTQMKSLHDALRGVRTELDLSGDPLARQVAAMRAQIAEILTAAIDPLPGRIRQMLRMRPAKDMQAMVPPEESEIAEIGALIEMTKACRHFAREFAVAELTARVWGELEESVDVHTRALTASLRADEPNLPHRQAQFQAALRFAALVFGQDHAQRLSRSAELAVAERKAVPA